MKRTYNFTSKSGLKGTITIDWEKQTYKVEGDFEKEGKVLSWDEGYTFSYCYNERTKRQDIGLKLEDGKILVMPNKLLFMDYSSFQKNWDLGYRAGDIAHILQENLQIVQGREVERPW